jgi:chromosome segregation ATPase
MEALLEKEGDVESWNDERLDELSGRVDDGFKEMREGFVRVDARFERLDTRLDARFDKIDARFDKIDARFDKLFLAIFTAGAGFAATTIAALIGALLL